MAGQALLEAMEGLIAAESSSDDSRSGASSDDEDSTSQIVEDVLAAAAAEAAEEESLLADIVAAAGPELDDGGEGDEDFVESDGEELLQGEELEDEELEDQEPIDVVALLNEIFSQSSQGGQGSQGSQEEWFGRLAEHCPELFQELYPGAACTHGAALLAVLQLMVEHHTSQQLVDSLLRLLCDLLLPAGNCMADSMRVVHKLLRKLAPGKQDVEVCWNDCVAFTDGLADATSCPVCNTARRHPKLGVKRLHETSIRTGLTRLFSQPSLVQHMRWAREGFAAEPGRLNSWLCGARVAAVRAELEAKGDTFFSDPDATNIVLALFLDGFNPHKDGTYSLTALCAMVLSLPPWLRAKFEHMLVYAIIDGPKKPKKMQVYLCRLVAELNTLFSVGIQVFDASRDCIITVRVLVLVFILDNRALHDVSGIQDAGHLLGCSCCEVWGLHIASRYIYQDARQLLPEGHELRTDPRWAEPCTAGPFLPRTHDSVRRAALSNAAAYAADPTLRGSEHDPAKFNGVDFLSELAHLVYPFDLRKGFPLASMHIIMGLVRRLENTLLGLSDSLAVRQACQTLGVHPLCWPREVNGRVRLRHPPWQLTAAGLRAAQEFLASAKPCSTYDGSPERLLQTARSAAGSVPTTKKKASAAKDALVTGLLAAATRAGGLPAAQQRAIDLLTDVVQRLLHPVPERADVEALKVDAAVAVAEFELTFPPTDMAYTVHALAHLPDEVLEHGPLHEIWEFSFERLLRFLKSAGAKQRAAVGAAIANRMHLHGQIQALAAVVEAGQQGAGHARRWLGPPPIVQTRGQALSSRMPTAAQQLQLHRWVESAMPDGFNQLSRLHALEAAMGGSQEEFWEWLFDPMSGPSLADLEPLSEEAHTIAGGFGRLQTFALVDVRGMHFRIQSRDEGKAYWNQGVAATWTSVDAGGGLEGSRMYLGLLQSVWAVEVGAQTRTLLLVRWYDAAAVVREAGYPGKLPLLRVRAGAQRLFEREEQLVDAAYIDAQFFLTDIANSRDKRVHFKLPSAYTLPPHLRAEHLEPMEPG